eukprot:TRINITY_DN31310_c0_g1_i1.p1 TRINITY_DN31310_c0_g1~~TRINITY_DN31310_c0_g1_i1.p1  ORF type:complete len:460 (+),score=97.75 TRINITY_DN31310_c0_g1_i1:108-1487(+)
MFSIQCCHVEPLGQDIELTSAALGMTGLSDVADVAQKDDLLKSAAIVEEKPAEKVVEKVTKVEKVAPPVKKEEPPVPEPAPAAEAAAPVPEPAPVVEEMPAWKMVEHAIGSWFAEKVGDEFTVVFEKKSGEKFGLELDVIETEMGLIMKIIPDGLVHVHNKTASADNKVQHHDRILKVNGAAVTRDKLQSLLAADGKLELTFQRPQANKVKVKGRGKLGLDLKAHENSHSILVEGVSADGAHKASGHKFQKSDRIIDVNGTHSVASTEILSLLRSAAELEITILSYLGFKARDEIYTVSVDKTSTALGLEFDKHDSSRAVIVNVLSGGAIESLNKKAASDNEKVMLYDRVLKVNGNSGNRDDLVKMCEASAKYDMTFQRPVLKQVHIDRKPGDKLGISCESPDGAAAILVTASSNPDVKLGDRIITVNGVSGNATRLVMLMQDSAMLDMVVASYPSDVC